MRYLKRHEYQNSTIIAVVEGVRSEGGYTSLYGVYGRENLPDGLLPLDGFHNLSEVPTGYQTGVDPVIGSQTISGMTATFVATDPVVKVLHDARSKGGYGEPFVWECPVPSFTGGFPGRYISDCNGTPPPHTFFHTTTATYEIQNITGSGYQVVSSLPLPSTHEGEPLELGCFQGSPQIAGKRLLILEVTGDAVVRTRWRGFIESFSLNSQQNEVEINAVDSLRVLEGTIDDRLRARITGDRNYFLAWAYYYDLEGADNLPRGETPGEIVIKTDDTYLTTGQNSFEDLMAGHGGQQNFTPPGDEDRIDDDRATVVFGHDPQGILGGAVGEGSVSGPEMLQKWLDFGVIQKRYNADGVCIYDGGPWIDMIDIDEMTEFAMSSPPISHSVIDSDTSISDLESWALAPLAGFLRLTGDGKLGMSRIRGVRPEEISDIISTSDSQPSSRALLLPDRIDVDHDVRRGEATYIGELGGVVDSIDPDRIYVRPGRAQTDVQPRYMGSERSFDFRWYQRNENGKSFVIDQLRDTYDTFRQMPIINAKVPIECFEAWGHSGRDNISSGWGRLPPVGDFVRLDGGPETGIVGPQGTRVRLRDLDVAPIGLLISKNVNWRDRTAEIKVLMTNWHDVMPRLVSPVAVISEYEIGGTTLVLDGSGALLDINSEIGFLIGDQVRLADRSGRYISKRVYEVHTVDNSTPRTVTLSSPLHGSDIDKIDFFATSNGRGVVLKLAEYEQYDNEWSSQTTEYFINPESATRIWGYWGAEPADEWVIT